METVKLSNPTVSPPSLDKGVDANQVKRVEVQEVYVKTLQKTVDELKATKNEGNAKLSEQDLQRAQEALSNFLDDKSNRSIRFSTDEPTGKTVITIVDKKTGEQIKQIPPQEFLDMVYALNKAASLILKDVPKYI